jgi:putative membrane protein
MRSFVLSTVATAVAFAIVTWLMPQFIEYQGGVGGLVVLAAIFGVVNGLIKPVVNLLALPLRVVTLGLIGFLVNAAMLLVTAWGANLVGLSFRVGDYPPTLFSFDTFVAAVIGAAVLGLINAAVLAVVPDETNAPSPTAAT